MSTSITTHAVSRVSTKHSRVSNLSQHSNRTPTVENTVDSSVTHRRIPAGSLRSGITLARIPTTNGLCDFRGPDPEKEDILSDQVVAAPSPPIGAAPPVGSAPAPSPAGPAPPAVTVTLPPRIRGTSSPSSMSDRIPPRLDTPVPVNVSGFRIPMAPIDLTIDGAGGGNGTATIDGAATSTLTASKTVNLRGVNQTDPANAGQLRLVARWGGTILDSSAAFSVSSIPKDWSLSFKSAITGARRGFVVQDRWDSDSGVVADLDKTEISEEVQYGAGSGVFAGVGGSNSGYLPGHVFTSDSHSTPTALITGIGSIVAEQTCRFRDHRSGSLDIPMANSGYRISRRAFQTGPNLFLETKKDGTATTANGVPSAAGAGSVSRTQPV